MHGDAQGIVNQADARRLLPTSGHALRRPRGHRSALARGANVHGRTIPQAMTYMCGLLPRKGASIVSSTYSILSTHPGGVSNTSARYDGTG